MTDKEDMLSFRIDRARRAKLAPSPHQKAREIIEKWCDGELVDKDSLMQSNPVLEATAKLSQTEFDIVPSHYQSNPLNDLIERTVDSLHTVDRMRAEDKRLKDLSDSLNP